MQMLRIDLEGGYEFIHELGTMRQAHLLLSRVMLSALSAAARTCSGRRSFRPTTFNRTPYLSSRSLELGQRYELGQKMKDAPVLTQLQKLLLCQLHERFHLLRRALKVLNRECVRRYALYPEFHAYLQYLLSVSIDPSIQTLT